MKKIIVDGENTIFGRLGSYVAKELLKGNEVVIINSDKVIISGNKEKEKLRALRDKGSGGSLKGPKYIHSEERLLKRKIRGMLPWDKPKGREAHKRLRCYNGIEGITPEELSRAKKIETRRPRKTFNIRELLGELK